MAMVILSKSKLDAEHFVVFAESAGVTDEVLRRTHQTQRIVRDDAFDRVPTEMAVVIHKEDQQLPDRMEEQRRRERRILFPKDKTDCEEPHEFNHDEPTPLRVVDLPGLHQAKQTREVPGSGAVDETAQGSGELGVESITQDLLSCEHEMRLGLQRHHGGLN